MRLLITLVASTDISFAEAVGMRMRGLLKPEFAHPLVAAHYAGLDVPRPELESHFLAGGDTGSVVNSCILLSKVGVEPNFLALAAADLAGTDVLATVEAFVKARKRFPELDYEEFSRRQWSGEDLIAAVKAGTFVPDAQSSGWRVRVERGPLTHDEVEAGLAAGEFPEDAVVLRPGSQEWMSIDRALGSR